MKFNYHLIRQQRLIKNWSQEELAFRSETYQDRISLIEDGSIKNPQLLLMIRICKALEIDIKEIIT